MHTQGFERGKTENKQANKKLQLAEGLPEGLVLNKKQARVLVR